MSIKKTISLLSTSHKGIANGVAELNESGTIPNSQLPSGVYDVIEGSMNEDLTEFTDVGGNIVTPETGKIYMDTSSINGLCYRYTGSEFVSLTTSSSGTGSANIIELTQAEYDALSEEDKMLDVLYLIKDADGGASVIKASATNDGYMSKEDKVKLDSLVMDENGVLSANNLPSYVDDVIEGTISSDESTFTDSNGETITPESGKIYVDITKNQSYRWSGSVYVSVGKDLALGETSETAYAGDKGKALADKIGTTDISSIGDGSVTGAISSLNSNLSNVFYGQIAVKCDIIIGDNGTMAVPDISSYKFIHAILYIMDNSTGGPIPGHWYCSAPCPVMPLKNDAATFNITQYDPSSGEGFKIRIGYINNTSLYVSRDSFNSGSTSWDLQRINLYLYGLK